MSGKRKGTNVAEASHMTLIRYSFREIQQLKVKSYCLPGLVLKKIISISHFSYFSTF